MDPELLSPNVTDVVAAGQVSVAELERIADSCADAIVRAKTEGSPMLFRAAPTRKQAVDSDNRTVRKIVSVERMDRMGDVIQLKPNKKFGGDGMDYANLIRTGGAFLWSHDAGGLPIGTIEKVYFGKVTIDGKKYNSMGEQIRYHEEDINPFAEVVWRLDEARKLPATSIGFRPLAMVYAGMDNGEGVAYTAEELGVSERWGVRFLSNELLETSAVNVPANADVGYDDETSRVRSYTAHEAALEASLEELVERDLLAESLVRDFRRSMAFSPLDATRRARAASKARVVVPEVPVEAIRSERAERFDARAARLEADGEELTVDATKDAEPEVIASFPEGGPGTVETIPGASVEIAFRAETDHSGHDGRPTIKELAALEAQGFATGGVIPADASLVGNEAGPETVIPLERVDGELQLKTAPLGTGLDGLPVSVTTVTQGAGALAKTAPPMPIAGFVRSTDDGDLEFTEAVPAALYRTALDAFEALGVAQAALGDILDVVEIPRESVARSSPSVLRELRRFRGELDSLIERAADTGQSGPPVEQPSAATGSDGAGVKQEQASALAPTLAEAVRQATEDFSLG